MPDPYDVAREWVRGFAGTGAHAELEEHYRQLRDRKRGFKRKVRQKSVRSSGDPLSGTYSEGAGTAGGPPSVTTGGPRCDVTRPGTTRPT